MLNIEEAQWDSLFPDEMESCIYSSRFDFYLVSLSTVIGKEKVTLSCECALCLKMMLP